MTKNLMIFLFAAVLTAIAAFTFSSQTNSTVPVSAQTNLSEMPDHIVYRHLFRHVAAFEAKADDLERQGKEAKTFRGFFKHKADLSDYQAQMLDQISAQCALEIKLIDERAKPIIEAYQANYPNGRVPHGQKPLPPPDKLRQLTQERNELVLRKRDELRTAFGEEAFGRFQQFVKNKIAPNVTAVSTEQ